MRKNLFLVTLLVFMLVMVASGCGNKTAPAPPAAEQPKAEKIKVGFVYVGSIGDGGWTYAHDQGRKYLEQNVQNVETIFYENVPEGADCERVINELVQKGCKVIFTTSFGFSDGTIEVAKKNPNVVFMHCSGDKTAPNVGVYFGRMQDAKYLAGLIAGKMTKTNKIGFVAAYPIPEVIRHLDAFTLGVREVNPKATVKVVWVNSWYDPAKEKEATKSLLEAGCDVLDQDSDSYAPQQAAEEKGIFCIGYDSDMRKYAPTANLTSEVWDWGPYYVKTVQDVIAGTWKSGNYWGPMSDNIVKLTPISDRVPADVKKLVEDRTAEIKAGKFEPFTGPIKDNTGKVKVEAGQKMSNADIWNITWLVEGVDGTVPAAKP
ncbi:MAG: BMP family ABC transporter substrate-binding protein [Firmicutes bacterium]|nr:BMP family ABC transporter substrate-binding protein [Bacillota bacterium]